jgi:hypothetical protein
VGTEHKHSLADQANSAASKVVISTVNSQAKRGSSAEADFRGQKRSNDTHASTTDPDARLYRKGKGKETKLCFIGHGLMENRHGLLVDACLTLADGHAERVAALHMIEPRADRPTAITLGADKAYDAEDFVNELRTPHVAQNTRGRSSAVDGRTTRHGGYAASQRIATSNGRTNPNSTSSRHACVFLASRAGSEILCRSLFGECPTLVAFRASATRGGRESAHCLVPVHHSTRQ